MSKYSILINILDRIRKEAPKENSRYYPIETDVEKLNNARSRAYLHLFLKVKFGLLEFKKRESFITDDSQDGGIDAYYIDQEAKKVYFLQSKFRTTDNNFHNKEIELTELLNMDVDRITEGEKIDERGNEYNGKIKQLVRKLSEISDIGRYKYEIVILANLKDYTPNKLKKLTGGFSATVFNYDRTYKELVFPVISGTFFNQSELKIQLNLNNKTSSSARISYKVKTEYKECEISVIFVPTIEIAKTLLKYKNSILKYNPRSYLELANNSVNKEIANTIENSKTNEFALFNNGITILSYGTEFNEKIGQKDKAQLIINQPQIINGGQTAFTLSRIYEENIFNDDLEYIFNDKEVLLKIITFPEENATEDPKQLDLIEAISKATNQQTPVDEADRRSNDKIQIELQDLLFNNFSYFYERKRGEYADGIRSGYIRRSQIIERDLFLRICKACDLQPSEARRSGIKSLFNEKAFQKTLNDSTRYREYFFGYRCYQELNELEKKYSRELNNRYGVATYGNAIRYGKFAVVAACKMNWENYNSMDQVNEIVNEILSRWKAFEVHIAKLSNNRDYFTTYHDEVNDTVFKELNFDNYYKGKTLNKDLFKYFAKEKSK